jgi:hypothetical protein
MPITLVLQPTILHSIFFFISLKIQQQTLFEQFQRDQKLECGVRPDQRYTRLRIPKLGGARTSGWILDLWPNIKRTNS